jgi:PAS domain S-box-containing protein
MNLNLTSQSDPAEADARMHRLSERVAQLEDENMLLEDGLRRNSRMFRALLGNGRDGITLTGPDRRIVRVVKGLTGIDAASLPGALIDSLAVPEDRQIIVAAYQQLLYRGCGTIMILVRLRQADGTVVRYTVTLTDMLDNPDVQGIVWNCSARPSAEPGL